jgi:transposase
MVGYVSLQGFAIEVIATRFKIDSATVRKWRVRFVDEGSAASPTESALERGSSSMPNPATTPDARPIYIF